MSNIFRPTYLFLVIGISLLLFVPTVVFAITAPGTLFVCEGSECTACKLFTLADNIIKFLIIIGISIATILIMWAGFLMLSAAGNPGGIQKAKSVFINVLIGIIITLAAFLIVDTIVRSLTNYSLTSLQDISCQPQTPITSTSTPTSNTTTGTQGVTPSGTGGTGGTGTGLTHTQATALLNSGITITSTAGSGGVRESCAPTARISSGGATGCTTLNGMQTVAVNALNTMQSSCNCSITVNGANEPGHDTHKNGLNWDLKFTSGLNNYFNTNVGRPENIVRRTSIGIEYKGPNGNCWLKEGNHYHISTGCRS